LEPLLEPLRRTPGRASETYLKPAASAASCGSAIVWTSATDSNKAFPFPLQGMNLFEGREFQSKPLPFGRMVRNSVACGSVEGEERLSHDFA
jgi:hypothetical protein